jgi:hypothetical protein
MKQIERQIDLLRIMVRNPAYRETLRKALDKTADTMEHLLAGAGQNSRHHGTPAGCGEGG